MHKPLSRNISRTGLLCWFALWSWAGLFAAAPPSATSLLPDVPGWKKAGPADVYQPANLYEYIDGAAELYLSFGFEELAVQNYANNQKQEITVEVYLHRDAAHAFGIYSQEKPPQGPFQAVGAQGYGDALSFNFTGGPYYFKLSFLGKSPDSAAQLKAVAAAVAARIPPPAALPAVLKAFPKAGRVAESEKFTAVNFLGQSFLHSAFTADFSVGGQTRQMFLLEGKDAADARAMVEKWAALAKAKVPAGGTGSFKDPFNGPVQLRIQGRFVWGCVGDWGPAAAARLEEMGKLFQQGQFLK
jgi:hypothetical protein